MIASSISSRNRARKYELFMSLLCPSEGDLILDVGFANREYSPVDNYLEKHYPYPWNITALGVGGSDLFSVRYPSVRVVLYDGVHFPFADQSFGIGWSNAVLEHVGDESAQILFLSELHRVCKRLYITTPNRYYPIELHTRIPLIHWLPKPLCDRLLTLFGKSWACGDYMHLLSHRCLSHLLTVSGISSYTIHKNRCFYFTMDFSVIVNK